MPDGWLKIVLGTAATVVALFVLALVIALAYRSPGPHVYVFPLV